MAATGRVGVMQVWLTHSPPPLLLSWWQCRTLDVVFLIQSAAHYVEMLCSRERPDLFVSMNKQIIKNLTIGIYDGCKVAVELARELAKL